jgi:hypothetical protein
VNPSNLTSALCQVVLVDSCDLSEVAALHNKRGYILGSLVVGAIFSLVAAAGLAMYYNQAKIGNVWPENLEDDNSSTDEDNTVLPQTPHQRSSRFIFERESHRRSPSSKLLIDSEASDILSESNLVNVASNPSTPKEIMPAAPRRIERPIQNQAQSPYHASSVPRDSLSLLFGSEESDSAPSIIS